MISFNHLRTNIFEQYGTAGKELKGYSSVVDVLREQSDSSIGVKIRRIEMLSYSFT